MTGSAYMIDRSPYWQEMVDALTICGAGFKAPSESDLSGPILSQMVDDVKKDLDEQRQIWSTKGCTIMIDGWMDRRNRTLLNFLVSSAGGTVFVKSIDASAHCKNATYLCEQIEEVIDEVGEENVVQVVTDNAANYVAAGRLLMERHPSIVWTPCAAHCIDLMLEDIGKIPWVKRCVERARNVCKFVYNHSWVLALMRQYTEQKELTRPRITRFATNFLTLQSMVRSKSALRRMIVGEEWYSSSYATTPAGKDMADCIFDEQDFWVPCDEIVKFVKPLVVLLRVADGEKPAMGYIYEGMDRAKEGIKFVYGGDESKYGPIWEIIDRRWHHQLHRPIHVAAYYLNPAFRFIPSFKADVKVLNGLYSIMEKMGLAGTTQIELIRELQLFSDAQGEIFSRPVAKDGRTTMMPAHWWSFFGPTTPNIQKLAIRILSQPCSASGCERNWSMFEHIHSKRCDRLSVEKMNDLVFVHYNLRLRMRKNALVDIFSPIILDEVDLEAEWANESQTDPEIPLAVFSDDDIDWIDQVDIEAEAIAMAEEEQRARVETGNTESDTTVPDVGEHGMVSRGATMAAKSSRTYLKRLRRGPGREGARSFEP
ncbi:uncharacterized protein LOC131047347 isoform X2 [Cryptomeria japonica]|uniref:uncharacterized protein LOC131047347 isoform X2 n=1 Tax=Cryptomeria japonica TaxID=3369 RepID=UPI0025AC87A9|nr:uncharacterized protein LOC131047347 isoform X2 [Cryptomeria japonica]XP_057837207.1 uncharacterized protein LOC131047347 isoform X2 [Cryptomeria japonica]XP_059069134.1 uncharacterized protein LOC131047347 isoform X2 [Cryptomeria japonica]XP_059069135.1 uncharacterized protein LOC131047347 isoform X2 [Cryptomeria japonica]XP_059069136.1 uncharacterized protein LOC131047347 isoform X2 [Cryptomeria japonica]